MSWVHESPVTVCIESPLVWLHPTHLNWPQGMIEAIYLDEGELISAGVDGYVRVWDFETIDNADITDENVTFEMDPLAEIKAQYYIIMPLFIKHLVLICRMIGWSWCELEDPISQCGCRHAYSLVCPGCWRSYMEDWHCRLSYRKPQSLLIKYPQELYGCVCGLPFQKMCVL